ncbi:hypothetical protein [Bosea sp. (in: a-proteobacteria)]|uniref:hypothetical protein n=1 Tax=Bosea sp. (in: a-proteobacteria) TaxID=1871050 RepID=UPI002627A163|nr:hypothetical protein [Bosea sp. (in: a-proteobacteria)]MCO5089936.1 hypothetical protein [Bosea sp. (in: a-proteobacteria)]
MKQPAQTPGFKRCRQEQAILFAAFHATLANARSVSLADHSAAQSLSAPCLSWQMLRVAKSLVMHPMDIGSTPRYGLQSVVRLMLAWKPSAIRALVDRERDHPMMSAIVRAAVQYLHPPSVERVRAVAATGCPLLVAIAAASMADQPAADLNEPTTCFADGWRELVAAGAAEADATWLMALHLKEAVHQRFRYTHGIEDDTRLLRWLRRKAPDLSNYEHHRLGHVTEELPRRREAAAIHEQKLDRILDDMARLWPAADLSVTQYQWLAQAFVDSAEIRHRLARRVAAASERTMLLKQNVEAWKAEVGLGRSTAEPFTEEYLPQLDTLFQQTLWAARSFVELNKNAKRGVAREVGLLLDPLTRDAQTILKEPFMAARRPARWQAALLRSAACALFALIVVGETPDDRRADVQVLASHALALTKMLVSESERIGASWELIYLAASIAIAVMADDALLSGQLTMWAQDSDLPMQVRAMAAWSSDDFLTRRLADATSLFAMAAKSPLLRASRDRHFGQLMSLLDIAVVSAIRLSDYGVADRLRSLWSDAIVEWPEQMEEWATAADWLMDAVKADGPQRAALLEHPSFASSRSRNACMMSA